MSHLLALRQAWNDGHEHVIIAEDDVDFVLYDENVLLEVINKLPKNWGSLQMYTGNPDLLEHLFKHFPATGFSSRSRFIHPWSQACVLYSREGIKNILKVFGFNESYNLSWVNNKTAGLEADVILPHLLGASAYLSTRPFANVRFALSTIDQNHMKPLLADLTIQKFAHLIKGKGYAMRYGNKKEILKTASHLQMLAHAYHSGLERVIVADNKLNVDSVNLLAIEEALKKACGHRNKCNRVVQLSTLLSGNTNTNVILLPRPNNNIDYSAHATNLYAVVGRDALRQFATLWEEKSRTVKIPCNVTFVKEWFIYNYLQKSSVDSLAPIYAPSVARATIAPRALANDHFINALLTLSKSNLRRQLYSCSVCPAGYYGIKSNYNHGTCLPCASGTYSFVSAYHCVACGAGKYAETPIRSSSSSNECKVCERGQYSAATSNNDYGCLLCPKGKKGSESQNVIDHDQETDCHVCDSGKYNEQDGQTLCKSCQKGKIRKKLLQ